MNGCIHIKTIPVPEPKALSKGCEECLKIGQPWVHLRKCLQCGHVGCCDQSIGKHATKHAQTRAHYVIKSLEPGEGWVYCYADDTYAE